MQLLPDDENCDSSKQNSSHDVDNQSVTQSFGCGNEDFVHCIQLITYTKKLRAAKLKQEVEQSNYQQLNHPHLQLHEYTNQARVAPLVFSSLTCRPVAPTHVGESNNFLLSSDDRNTLIKRSIILLSTYAGFESATRESLDTLTTVTEIFIRKITLALADSLDNRSLKDFYSDQVRELFKILDQVGFSVPSLIHYSACIRSRKRKLINTLQNEFNVQVNLPSSKINCETTHTSVDQNGEFNNNSNSINIQDKGESQSQDDIPNGSNFTTGSVASLTTSTTPLTSSLTSTVVTGTTDLTNSTVQATIVSGSNDKLITTHSSTLASSSHNNIWDKSMEEIQMLTDSEILGLE